MIVRALVLRADGTTEKIEYDPTDAVSLAHIQEAVGGWIEAAPIANTALTMYCNEHGKMRDLPRNERATRMLHPQNSDWIAGDVVLVGAPDKDGYDTDLPEIILWRFNVPPDHSSRP